MMRFPGATCAGAIAALFSVTAGVAEDRTNLSEEEVTSFFSEMESSVTEMVRNEDYESLVDWVDETFADEASFFFGMDLFVDEERKSFTALRLNKDDMNRLGRISVGVMAGVQGEHQAITDYDLNVEVLEVVPAGPDAATVTTRITESASFSLPAQPEDDQTRDSVPGSIRVEATADCQHLIRRSDNGAGLVLGLTGCGGSMRL